MTTNSSLDRVVEDNSEQHRFEIRVGDALAGFAEYRLHPGRVVVTHTEVDPSFEGQGIGGALVRGALDQVRAQGLRVTPQCPFVKAYIDKHEEYQDLVGAP